MGTPKLSKNLKTPLSTIKKGPVKGLRNILVHPQEFLWPILKDERIEELNNSLKELLPHQRSPRPVSWTQLRKMSKEERMLLKKEMKSKKADDENQKIISGLALGINAVTRALEKGNVASILLDSNVEPLLMIKHVVTMGQNKNIPVILVPFLKNITLEKLGFASAALGLKKSSIEDENSPFLKLHEKISSTSDEFPKVTSPIELFPDEDEAEETEDEEILPENPKKSPPQPFKLPDNIYLYRPSIHERAFIPPNSQESPKIEEEKSWSDFISFGDDPEMDELDENMQKLSKKRRYVDLHEDKPKNPKKKSKKIKKTNNENNEASKNKSEPLYRPLKVKRVQGNPKRLKATKVAKIKKKTAKNPSNKK